MNECKPLDSGGKSGSGEGCGGFGGGGSEVPQQLVMLSGSLADAVDPMIEELTLLIEIALQTSGRDPAAAPADSDSSFEPSLRELSGIL